jgi:hypothetical protein
LNRTAVPPAGAGQHRKVQNRDKQPTVSTLVRGMPFPRPAPEAVDYQRRSGLSRSPS